MAPQQPPLDYKTRKEAFVSNLTGGTLTEINTVLAIAPIAYLLWAALQSRLKLFTRYTPALTALDGFINCAALLLAVTLYADNPITLNLLFLVPAILLLIQSPSSSSANKKPKKPITKNAMGEVKAAVVNPLPKKPFLTVYRGTMMVITCIAILAVDFPIFPRRFAKVENWGTSIMDLGVGSFVFSGGLVAARTVIKAHLLASGHQSIGFGARMKTAMRSALPLLVLGFVRLAMVKGVEYAEHVTEYGVHWNFFFTLGLLPPFLAVLQTAAEVVGVGRKGKASPVVVYTVLSLLVGGIYQAVLLTTGLQEYVLVGDRHKFGLLGMNKEGAASFFGYLSIFLAGMATGCYVLPREVPSSKGRTGKVLLMWCGFWTVGYLALTEFWGARMGVSRRLANLPYVCWVASFNTGQLYAFWEVKRLCFREKEVEEKEKEEEIYKRSTPWVLEAFNRNGLAIFLVSNLLTGLVNVTVKTLDVGRAPAMGILGGYLLVLTGLAVGLDYFNINVKL